MGTLFLDLLVSALGLGYFIYGKKLQDFKFLLCGIGLMFYPYLIGSVSLKLLIGIILAVSPFFIKKIY